MWDTAHATTNARKWVGVSVRVWSVACRCTTLHPSTIRLLRPTPRRRSLLNYLEVFEINTSGFVVFHTHVIVERLLVLWVVFHDSL